MLSKIKILVLLFNLTLATAIKAQSDSIIAPVKLNQVYVEIFGNNVTYFSAGYSRKITTPHNNWIIYGGLQNPVKVKASDASPSYTAYSFISGFLFRKKYKRNGAWLSFSDGISIGKFSFVTNSYFSTGPGGGSTVKITSYHDIDFQFSPGACYQWQSKSEGFFFGLNVCLKLFSPLFAHSYRDVNDHTYLFPWAGIALGGSF